MRLLLDDELNLDQFIDDRYRSDVSIVLRYRNALTFGEPEEDSVYKDFMKKTSIREGARIFPLLTYRGVDIHILDESSLMHTGTLKSIDGCITISKCRLKGYERVVFESGGNTGTALTEYGQRAGLETFFFVPEENVSLLHSRTFEPEKAHLISVGEPGLVKKAAGLFKGLNGIRHIPQTAWRYEASTFRGLFILEHMMQKENFDWLAQTISAAFGPIGIYGVLSNCRKKMGDIPRFLGIQQEANCPMYNSWKAENKEVKTSPVERRSGEKLLSKVMYDVAPHTYGTYEDLKGLLTSSGGDLMKVGHSEFLEFLEHDFDGKGILDLLGENGFEVFETGGEVLEKTGLIALAGTFKGIRNKEIAGGSKVLCCLSSGTYEVDGKAQPEYRVSGVEHLVQDCHRMIYGE
jgi:hypothetical protein